jgi:hypothetical protein
MIKPEMMKRIDNDLYQKRMPLAARIWKHMYPSNFHAKPLEDQRKFANAIWQALKEEGLINE